jgi:predicted transposase YdaD
MAERDLGYKRLFAHREMVADLLTGFIREPWVAEVELDTLERVSGSYVSDDLREREDDIIWRVRWCGRWLYVYLLLEFQASVDRFMALRMLVYVGLCRVGEYAEPCRGTVSLGDQPRS